MALFREHFRDGWWLAERSGKTAVLGEYKGTIIDHVAEQWQQVGFNAFLRSSDGKLGVAFERHKSGSRGLPWSTDELRVCVLAYWKLITAEARGERINKTELRNKALANGLSTRSKSAYEFRMQNISAVLEELGLRRATGYAPMKNVGGVKATLIELINEQWGRSKDF